MMRETRVGSGWGAHLGQPVNRRAVLRRAAGVIAVAPVLSLLAACGGDGDEPTSTPAASGGEPATEAPSSTPEAVASPTDSSEPEATEAPTEAAEPTGTTAAAATEPASTGGTFPATVTHKYGTTTVESEPTRIVTLGYNDQDQVLAFGVTPVASRYWYGDETNVIFPWAEASLTGPAPAVLNMPELDFELIATYSPDLIIAIYSGITEEEYATLSQIAPTVAQLGDYIDYGMPWEETTRLVGAALGQPERAEEIISEIDDLFTTYRAENPIFEESTVAVAAMREDGSNFALFNVEDGRARIITGLGLTIPESIIDVLDPNTFFTNFSNEQLNILNSVDVVTWLQVPFAGGRDAIEKNPLYARLRVATEGRHVFVEGDVDNAIAFNSPLSIAFTLEAIVPHLVAALDGDPTTNEPPMA